MAKYLMIEGIMDDIFLGETDENFEAGEFIKVGGLIYIVISSDNSRLVTEVYVHCPKDHLTMHPILTRSHKKCLLCLRALSFLEHPENFSIRVPKINGAWDKKEIEGYGPPDLIQRLKQNCWKFDKYEPEPKENRYLVIKPGGYYPFRDKPSEGIFSGSDVKYRVTVETPPNPEAEKFTVEVYGHPSNFIESIMNSREECPPYTPYPPITIIGHVLGKTPSKTDNTFYRVTLETI